ncbi:hypothetical protein [Streptomyces sp. 147326]|uniref:hypothetical protein n=1 Tax=Streptomyces sp. 147326 TaxID=3074379 RepID=UPI0038577A43
MLNSQQIQYMATMYMATVFPGAATPSEGTIGSSYRATASNPLFVPGAGSGLGGVAARGERSNPAARNDGIKIALAVAASIGGVMALVVDYRRQHLNEASEVREHDRAFTDRFGAAADQLGTDQPAARMAGAYAMARLADEWRTVLRLIAAHLRDDSTDSWPGYDLDLTGARVNFPDAAFAAGEVRFEDAEFADGLVDFAGSTFTGTAVNFGARHLPNQHSTVPPARFGGGTVDFSHAATFSRPPRFGLDRRPQDSGGRPPPPRR